MIAVLLAKVRANEQLGQAIVVCVCILGIWGLLNGCCCCASAMKSLCGSEMARFGSEPQTLPKSIKLVHQFQSIYSLIDRHSRGEVQSRPHPIPTPAPPTKTTNRPDTPSPPSPPCQQLPPVAPRGVWLPTSSVPRHRNRSSRSFHRCTASPSNSTWSNSSAHI